MQIGISTANLYPLLIENSFERLSGLGATVTEVFVNTVSELEPHFVADMKQRATAAGLEIRSLHSYTSCFEPYMLFSPYERRFEDGLSVLEDVFKAAALADAEYVILHGDKANGVLSPESLAARYERLYDLGQTHGVTLLQENTAHFRACTPEHVHVMRQVLGDKAKFVLDFKQCRRSGVTIGDMIDAMSGAICHVHISDATAEHDCLMPGDGDEDFVSLLSKLKATGFDGALIIELYRHNFDEIGDFSKGCDTLRRAIAKI